MIELFNKPCIYVFDHEKEESESFAEHALQIKAIWCNSNKINNYIFQNGIKNKVPPSMIQTSYIYCVISHKHTSVFSKEKGTFQRIGVEEGQIWHA